MRHLEKLTLYLRIRKRNLYVVDGTHLYNEILVHMPQLHTFIFYISTIDFINPLVPRKSIDDIQQTFRNIKYERTACIIDYSNDFKTVIHVYSLPFTFTYLGMIS